MKKLVLSLVLLFAVSPAWALFCQYCGKGMAEDAIFCSQCGKQKVAIASAPAVMEESNKLSPDAYDAVDKYEIFLTIGNAHAPSAKASEYRYKAAECLRKQEANLGSASLVQMKMHSLYVKKYDVLQSYLDAWNRSINGTMKVQAAAEREKQSFILARTNEMISVLKANKNDPSVISRIDGLEKDLAKLSREYLVTSPYLSLEGKKVIKNQPIWVMEVQVGRARVMHMGESNSALPIAGWISMYDLQYRTTWRSDNLLVIYEPAPITTEVVIVDHEPWWRPYPPRHYPHDEPHHWGRSRGRRH